MDCHQKQKDGSLQACPFCGAKPPGLLMSLVLTLAFWHVGCWRCGAEGPKRVTRKRALDAWNRRA